MANFFLNGNWKPFDRVYFTYLIYFFSKPQCVLVFSWLSESRLPTSNAIPGIFLSSNYCRSPTRFWFPYCILGMRYSASCGLCIYTMLKIKSIRIYNSCADVTVNYVPWFSLSREYFSCIADIISPYSLGGSGAVLTDVVGILSLFLFPCFVVNGCCLSPCDLFEVCLCAIKDIQQYYLVSLLTFSINSSSISHRHL